MRTADLANDGYLGGSEIVITRDHDHWQFVYSDGGDVGTSLNATGGIDSTGTSSAESNESFSYASFGDLKIRDRWVGGGDYITDKVRDADYSTHLNRQVSYDPSASPSSSVVETTTGDSRVNVTGQYVFDNWCYTRDGVLLFHDYDILNVADGTGWYRADGGYHEGVYDPTNYDPRTDYEKWIDGSGAQPSDSGEPPVVEPTFYPPNPYTGNSLLGWFAGQAGDAGDQAIYVTGIVADIAAIPGTIILEPLDWAMTAKDIVLDPTDPLNYLGLIPGVPASAKKVFDTPGIKTAVNAIPPVSGVRNRGSRLGQEQGREFRTDQLQLHEFDASQPKHVRGWLENERRRIASGNGSSSPRNPPGYVLGHGRTTPAREGYDYSNSRLQLSELNKLEETVRRILGAP